MGYALSEIKHEFVHLDASVATRPNPTLYLIQFRRNIQNVFGAAIPINSKKGSWELHGSYETEKDMLTAFDVLCKKPNVMSGLYTFRCVWPDGRTQESKAIECLTQ